MKKINLSLILLLCFLLLFGCVIGQKTQLAAPEVFLAEDGSYIYWDPIPNAVLYEVTVNGEKNTVRNATEFYFTSGGLNMTVTVKAKGDGLVFLDSEVVSITGDFTIAMAQPSLTVYRVIKDLHIEWDAVDDAAGYIVIINDVEKPHLSSATTSYVFPLPEVGTYVINVKTKAPSAGYYVDSKASVFTFVYTLPTPAALAGGETTTKLFDKADNIDVAFLININDDTTYSLTGEGITTSDYNYNGTQLTIFSDYLKNLTLGDKTFTFETEQFSVTLTVTINDTRGPQLANSGINFNIGEVSHSDIEIELLLNGATLNNVYLDDVLQVLDTDYSYSNSKIIFDADVVKLWSLGEYEVKITLSNGSASFTLYFTINVIDTTEPYSEQTSLTFDKGTPLNIIFSLVMKGSSFSKVQGNITASDYSYSSNNLTIKQEYLSTLEVGLYNYIVYTSSNAFAISVNVVNTANICYNIRIDLDSNYPNILLRWDYDGSAIDFYYQINSGPSVGPVTGRKQDVLSGVTKNNPFTVKVRPASGTFSPDYTYSPVAAGVSYMSSGYTFMGETYDYYINSQEEFNNFIYYAAFDRSTAIMGGSLPSGGANNYGYKVMPEVFIAFDYGTTIGSGDDVSELGIALNSIPLKGSFSVASSMYSDGRVTFTMIFGSDEEPSMSKASENPVTQHNLAPSHIEDLKGSLTRSPVYDSFPINSITKTQSVRTSEQLLNVVESGLKPIAQASSTADVIYAAAKDVLRDIITDDMSDVDKVHAIYDWLIVNVRYDHVVLDIYNNPSHPDYINLNKYNCFYLEGIFIDGVAVCDGFAKAFVLLARIEGIEAYKVSGISNGVNHAWNKVKVNGNWYTVDSTWGNLSSSNNEYLIHAYLMVSDIDLYNSHRESEPMVAAPVSYEYYKNTYYAPGKSLYISSKADFDNYYSAVGSGDGYLEFYNDSGLNLGQLFLGHLGVPSYQVFTIGKVLFVKF